MNEENKIKIEMMLKKKLSVYEPQVKSTDTILRKKNINNISNISNFNRKSTVRNNPVCYTAIPPPLPHNILNDKIVSENRRISVNSDDILPVNHPPRRINILGNDDILNVKHSSIPITFGNNEISERNDSVSVQSFEYDYRPNVLRHNNRQMISKQKCCNGNLITIILLVFLFLSLIIINDIILFHFTNLDFN